MTYISSYNSQLKPVYLLLHREVLPYVFIREFPTSPFKTSLYLQLLVIDAILLPDVLSAVDWNHLQQEILYYTVLACSGSYCILFDCFAL